MKKLNLGEIAITRIGVLSLMLFLMLGSVNTAFAQNPIRVGLMAPKDNGLPPGTHTRTQPRIRVCLPPATPVQFEFSNYLNGTMQNVDFDVTAYDNNNNPYNMGSLFLGSLTPGGSFTPTFNLPVNFVGNSGELEVTVTYQMGEGSSDSRSGSRGPGGLQSYIFIYTIPFTSICPGFPDDSSPY